MLKNKRLLILAAYLFTAVYLLPMFPHGGSANELTRWATAASLIEKGSFEISWTEPLIGPNVDTARVGDRTYSNKAPGTAILAAPIYALTRMFIGPPDASNIRISWFAMRLVLSTLPLLLLGVWLYRRGADETALAALLFATPLFLYSLLFFSHVYAAVAVYAAFGLMFDEDKGKTKHLLWAGLLTGFAVISEFPAVFAVAVFGIGLLLKGRTGAPQRVLNFALGGLPFIAFLLIYNNALFGSPLSMSYSHESFPEWAEVAGQGAFGIGMPSLSNAYVLLFSPSRGLFFSSPILLLSVYLVAKNFDRNNVRKMVRLAAVAVGILIICGHGAAHGGWAFGPRYLIFIIPLLLDPFFEGEARRLPDTLLGLTLGTSIILSVIPALTFPFAPPEFMFPHNDFWMSFVRGEGWIVPNLANVFGVSANIYTLLPVFAVMIAVLCMAAIRAADRGRFLAGLAIGVVLVAIYVFIPWFERGDDAFRRATIAERYFRPADRLEQFAAATGARPDRATHRKINTFKWTIADARAYAPDDFPYLESRQFSLSPSAAMKAALHAQKQGNTAEAEQLLLLGKQQITFARCEFSTNLAVIFFTTNRKDAALAELEGVQSLVDPASRAECMRSQFLLGSLYRELGRTDDANAAFQRFMSNSAGTTDAELQGLRKQLVGQ